MDPAAARRAALADIGGIEQVKEDVRDGRSGAWLDTLLLDLRYACRGFAKAPGLTATIVITLALGIGANTAIFSVVHAMLLSPLPYRDADRLVFIWSDMTAVGYPRAPLSGPELKDLRDGSRTLSGVAAIWSNTTALTGDGHPEQLRIGLVTPDFFSVLGAEPALGRTFRPDDGGDNALHRDPSELGSVPTPLRRRRLDRRPHDPRRRSSGHRHRRDAARLPVAASARRRRARSPAGLDALLGHRARPARPAVPARDRPDASRRHAGGRARRGRRHRAPHQPHATPNTARSAARSTPWR